VNDSLSPILSSKKAIMNDIFIGYFCNIQGRQDRRIQTGQFLII